MAEQFQMKSHRTNKWVAVSVLVAADVIVRMTVDQLDRVREGEVVYVAETDDLVRIIDA